MLGVLRVALPGSAFAQTWPTLISLWTFDETGGASFADSGPANVPMDINGTWADLSTASMIQGIGGTSAYTGGSGYGTIPANHPDHDLSELTISFYYQRNSAAGKQILLAAGDGFQPGDISIEVLANGRLRGYHVGQDGVLRFFESSSGVTGTDLQVGTAHRIDLTLGSLGARIYLDGAPLINAFILANTNGWNNSRTKYLGVWIDGVAGPADGAFDGFRIWDQQLTSVQIATLEPAQSIDSGAPELAYTVPVAPSGPAAGAIYVATTGNDTTGDGTLGNPYNTLGKAISVAPSNNGQIVLRKGIYRGEQSLNASGKTNLTIRGYRDDILPDPLNSSNWPIVDGCFNPAGITWELVDSGRQEYRTVQTTLGSGIAHGMIVAGTATYQIPRWEPLGGLKNPTPMFRLWPYNGTTGPRSLAAFRHTGPVAFSDHNGYCGPGTYRMDDGRIHIRLQPIDPSVNGGEPIDQIPSKVPTNNQIFLWQPGNELFADIANGFRLEGVFVRGYHRLYRGGNVAFQLNRSVFWCGEYINYYMFFDNPTSLTIRHSVFDGGHADWFAFRLIKSISVNGGLNWGRITPFAFNGTGSPNTFDLQDSIVINISDLVVADNSDTHTSSVMKILNNAVIAVQDIDQVVHGWHNREIAYNWIRGPLCGNSPGGSMSAGQSVKIHHNIAIWNHMQINEPGQRIGWPMTVGHGSESGWRSKVYYNTIVYANPQENTSDASIMSRPPRDYDQTGEPHESFNNIYIMYNRHPPGSAATSVRYMYNRFWTNNPNKRWVTDGNGFFVVKDPTVGADSLFQSVKSDANSSFKEFTSLNAFRGDPYYTASIGNYGYADGMETNSVQGDPDFVGPNAEKQDCRGKPPSDYVPQAGNYKAGAVNLSPTGLNRGWPGTSVYQAWRGALDPDGNGTEIGPRTAV